MKKSKIEELYENQKSRGFVNHLIQSYLPIYKTHKVFDFEKAHAKKCNVCGQPLMSIDEALSAFQENKEKVLNEFMENIKGEVNGKSVKYENKAMVKHVVKGRVLALTGEKTDTCLCTQCVQDLLELTQNGLLSGDKNISYQMNKMRRDSVFNHFDNSNKLSEKEKEKAKEIKKKVDKKRTTTFGDIDTLKELHDKMIKDEKNKS